MPVHFTNPLRSGTLSVRMALAHRFPPRAEVGRIRTRVIFASRHEEVAPRSKSDGTLMALVLDFDLRDCLL